MDCSEFLHRYSEYDDSLVPAREADRFRAHMASCSSCARYDRVLRKGRMLARQLPPVEPDDDFLPDLQRRLLASHGRRAPLWGSRVAAGLAAATVVMVAAASLQILDAPGATASVAGAPGATEETSGVVQADASASASRQGAGSALFGIEPATPRFVRLTSGVAVSASRPGGGWVARQVAREVASAPPATYSPAVAGSTYRVRRPATFTLATDSRALD